MVSYGVDVALINAVGLLTIIIVAFFLRCIPETAIVLFVLLLLRATAGGAHCAHPLSCNIVSTLVVPGLGKIAATWPVQLSSPLVITSAGVFVLVTVLLFAPVDHPHKPIKTSRHRIRLRKMALALVLGFVMSQLFILAATGYSGLALVSAVSCALLWEGFVLTRGGWLVMAGFDWFTRSLTRSTQVGR